jgi:ATP/maltotriose-dependent transcriptional regulator MalT
MDHVELLTITANAHAIDGDRGRAEIVLQKALEELDPGRDPRRYSALLARLARIQWTLNRGPQGVETAQRALAMLPEGETSRERASLLAWLARTRFLRGRFRAALEEGEQALAMAVAAHDRRSESEVLNTLGMTLIALGQVDEGLARVRRALEIAREDDDVDGLFYAYSNLADLLNLAGRAVQALEVAKEGLAAIARRGTRSHDWMMLTVSEVSFELGDWKAAQEHLGPPASQLAGVHLIFRLVREAELALGVGDDELAARCLEELEPLVATSSEPQWIGALGALLGELRRRRYELPGARAAVERALDRIELCTDDVMRIARVTAVGARIEADVAQRARDLRERAQERDALARARIHMQRLRAAAQEGGPVERAWQAIGAAELSRARGRDDPDLWVKAAARWDELSRPYQAAVARWRAAEAHVEHGERDAAAEEAGTAAQVARSLGSKWLVDEIATLAERARLQLEAVTPPITAPDGHPGAEDPFGLTPRERQVLALIAEGATNRQIGATLFMAEKTASVHVSRILSKLGVRSRTQAAAVAHRLHLDRYAAWR